MRAALVDLRQISQRTSRCSKAAVQRIAALARA
jgi:hypothetical protein